MRLQDIPVEALIDSGSQISCISEEFMKRNTTKFKECEILPLVNMSAVGATGGRPVKIKEQIYVNVNIKDHQFKQVFLIIPGLTQECILGIDLLKEQGSIIDLRSDVLKLSSGNEIRHFPLIVKEVEDQTNNDLNSLENPKDTKLTWEMINKKIDDNLLIEPEIKETYKELIWRYRRVFDQQPGRISCYHHKLKIKDNTRIKSKSYPLPIKYEKEIEKSLQEMMDWNIISRADSPIINPLVPVLKKNGKVRLCLDARNLNSALEEDHEGTENIDVLLQRCNKKKLFTRLDLNMSFWQIPLTEESKKYTAFLYKGKCYQHNVTPFGLKTSTAALVRGLDKVLTNLMDCVISYVDDLLISSKNEEEHLKDLERILNRLQEHNVTLNFEKCEFKRGETNFLGYIISPEGIKPDPKKIQAIRDFKTPTNKKQLQGFLGIVNFSAKFSSKLAKEIQPMLELLKKGHKWAWTTSHEEAFQRVKGLFQEQILLHFPDLDQPIYIQTDASDYALGSMIYQMSIEGDALIITCGSRTLRSAEIAYNTTEKELLALVWTLQKYRNLLMGCKIIHKTDHAALKFLQSCKWLSGRLMRWTLAIQDFNITVEHHPGRNNQAADALSRYVVNTEVIKFNTEKRISLYPIVKKMSKQIKERFLKMKEEQKMDPKIEGILKGKLNEEKYELTDQILYKKCLNQWKIYLPHLLADELIKHTHEVYAHIGAQKCQKMISEDFFVPNLLRISKTLFRSCEICQKNKAPNYKINTIPKYIDVEKPGQVVFLDCYGPLPTARLGNRYILAILDGFTKYIKLYPIRKQTTDATIKKLILEYIPSLGKPERIVTDHGTQFTSELWRKKLEAIGIKHTLTSIRHPQANMVERSNREISKILRIMLHDLKHTAWYEKLPIVETILNEVYHDTTGATPMELQLGRRPSRFWKSWIPSIPNQIQINKEQKLMLCRERIRKKGLDRISKLSKDESQTYKDGDLVLVKAYNLSDKLLKQSAKFMAVYEGPYMIEQPRGSVSFILSDPKTKKIRGKFHCKDLRRFHQS